MAFLAGGLTLSKVIVLVLTTAPWDFSLSRLDAFSSLLLCVEKVSRM